MTAHLPILQGQIIISGWDNNLILTGLTLSMTVNALVTGLIVFRIFKVFQELKTRSTDNGSSSTFQRIIFIIIESGMALFSIQLARLVLTIVSTGTVTDTYYLIAGIHEILNVIIRSVIDTLFY